MTTFIIEYRFLVTGEPKDKYEALELFNEELKTNLVPEEYLTWRKFDDERNNVLVPKQ
jgi:hypothetical protein